MKPNSILILKQITITDRQKELLIEESKKTGISVSSIIKGLISEHYRIRGLL